MDSFRSFKSLTSRSKSVPRNDIHNKHIEVDTFTHKLEVERRATSTLDEKLKAAHKELEAKKKSMRQVVILREENKKLDKTVNMLEGKLNAQKQQLSGVSASNRKIR